MMNTRIFPIVRALRPIPGPRSRSRSRSRSRCRSRFPFRHDDASARGVTLVEVLIVVAILSLIAGGVAIFAIPKFQQAQKDTSKTDCKTLVSVVETYKLNHVGTGNACPTIEDLKNDKALKADQNINDPWGKPYKIVCTGEDFGVMSPGPDGKEGTEDDIWAGTKPTK